MSNIPLPGTAPIIYIATNTITRDGVTEHMVLQNIVDQLSALSASVTPLGTAGVNGLCVQGGPGAQALPVTGSFSFTPWNYTIVTASGPAEIKGGAGVLGALINLDPLNPIAAEITVWDDPAANSGNKVGDFIGLATSFQYGDNGMAMTQGISLNLSQSVPKGVLVLWQ